MSLVRPDMSPRIDLTRRHQVGPRRTEHPEYVALKPPCNHACPAGENIQAWLAEAQAGKWKRAWEILVRDNPFPSIHGRVCYHPCETSCNRGELDATVSIHSVERFIGDTGQREGWQPTKADPSGKRVLIVGAGPSGLSAAWHLAVLGHEVEIYESAEAAGGMMRYGIPAYRLPRDILDGEVARLTALGVKIRFNHKVEDLLRAKWDGHFDAVYVAVGAQVGRHVDIPARDAARVLDAVNVLRQTAGGEPPQLGRRVAVYGGGNTAIDVARSAHRLGADDIMLIYHRDAAHMGANAAELQEALAEGVTVHWLSSVKEMHGGEITVEKTRLDENGRVQPTGEFETLGADALVMALGQATDVAFLGRVPGIQIGADGTIQVGEDLQTGHEGIFAGGDVVPSQRTVTRATGQGKLAARHIDRWLAGEHWQHPPSNRVIRFEELHLPLFDDAAQVRAKELPLAERLDFTEVVAGIDEPTALHEARRCLSCGNCYECDNCYAACPEQAIAKLGPGRGYQVDLALCTGCEVCFEQCPCHAIDMIPESVLEEKA